jgi:hypothetical protein
LFTVAIAENIEVVELSSNVLHTDSLAPMGEGDDYGLQLNYYKIEIPENFLKVETVFTTTGCE